MELQKTDDVFSLWDVNRKAFWCHIDFKPSRDPSNERFRRIPFTESLKNFPVMLWQHSHLSSFVNIVKAEIFLRCYLIKNVAMFMKKSIFLKIQDLRPLNTC